MRLARSALLLAVFLLPWNGVTSLPAIHPRAAWVDVALLLALACWAIAAARRRARPRLRPVHGWMALYFGWTVVSWVFHRSWGHSSVKVFGVAVWVMAAVATSVLLRGTDGRRTLTRCVEYSVPLVAGAASLGVLLASWGVVTPLVGAHGDLLAGHYARAQAGFSHPNLLGSYCLFATAFIGVRDERGGRARRGWLAVLVAATALLAMSRAALALAVAFGIAAADTRARRRLVAVLTLAVAGAYLSLTLHDVRVDPTRPRDVRLAARPGPRLEAARSAIQTLVRRPFLGSGPAAPPATVDGRPFDAHLTALNVASGLGLPAFVALVGMGAALFRARGRPTDRAVWGALAAIALDGLAQDVENFRHVWILLGVADSERGQEQA